ncbi:hypothetical protein E1263_02740 [Kribbella antibiotica]|uniref:Uncharacterized protein n=1 Tax=Kribbella antibiotica TaxID=190195 RepID=A0A4R4ZU45_9ACTN|nr:hypothetical protein [Kribbella antibiotica]TDD62651.1 hypothetical protein E1263_02740 [Kribbella antibiotica]
MIEYCFKWNYADGRPGVPLTVDEARDRDLAGTEFTAILPARLGSTSPVLVTPVWATGVLVVTFLDEPGRKATEYTFQKRTDDRLFLTRVHTWTYPTDEPGLRLSAASTHETVLYQEDGLVKRVVKDKVERTQETVEYADVPVDSNWEPIPVFGDYGSIARWDR